MMEWNALLYDGSHGFVPKYGLEVLDMLGDISGKSVLDAGCGTGTLAAEAARRGANVLGVDADENMLKTARKNYPQLTFERCKLEEFKRDCAFDCVYSNAVLHWIADQEKVAENIYACLKDGGMFACEFGGAGNADTVLTALKAGLEREGAQYKSPFRYRGLEFKRVLVNAGFAVKYIKLFPRMTALKGEDGLDNWIRQFCRETLPKEPERVLEYVRRAVKDKLFFDGAWHVDYMRLRFLAEKRL